MRIIHHAAPIQLEPGSIILPGNWGRIIQAIGERHSRYSSEHIFEEIRRERFAHLPSRLEACFACPTEIGIRFFGETAMRGNPCPSVLYEVEKVDPDAPEHLADYNLFQVNKQGETIEGNAERYWSGDFWYEVPDGPAPDFRCEEIVTMSALRVIRDIS